MSVLGIGSELSEALSREVITYTYGKRPEHVFGRIVFSMTLVVRNPHLPDGQRAALAVIDELRQMIPDETYRWWWTREGTRPSRVAKKPPPPAAELLHAAGEAPDAFTVWLWDSDNPDYDAPAHYLKLRYPLRIGTYETPVGTLQLTVPLDWLVRQEDGWALRTFVALCTRMKPRFGYAGFAMTSPYDNGATQWNLQVAYPLLRRSPGINCAIGNHLIMTLGRLPDDEGGMTTIDWLTAADAHALDLCGGEPALREAFGEPDFLVYFTGGGVVVRAGPHPQIGNLDAGITLPHYGHVAHFFRPARFLDFTKMVNLAYGSDDSNMNKDIMLANQKEWLTRFDEM
ncbi:MAG: type VI immunity family protein [Gammaproteobacteria bacterium]